MNALISQLFTSLNSPEDVEQAHALAQLSDVLDQAVRPDVEPESMPPELRPIQLTASEIDEVIEKAIDFLDHANLEWATRTSLLLIAVKNADPKYANPLLKLFSKWADAFDEQQAFSSIAQLTNFVMRASREDRTTIQAMLVEYDILTILQNFEKHASLRLRQSAKGTITYFHTHIFQRS